MGPVVPLSRVVLRELGAKMVGMRAWRSRAGSGPGSIFTLEFGAALPGKTTQGEFSLMVYCAWRLVAADQGILCSWHDDSDGVLAPALAALEGSVVEVAEVSEWFDLTLGFSNGQALHLLNDFSPHQDFDTSWFVTYQGQSHYCVNTDNSLTLESATR
ncbi:hypothetical protein [Hymenobacter chitinivorans]|uniref:Uncharacterized protein n=1 Tax=Hymenobacter chitinivorans DSM 11115 TaxID=1121954 RepID=A0A2M9BQT6_9BACT|nr:hypothetical protein [Hymenobacter chitinivorans]PJJ60305.1 hypothetical protein CLV45_1730 [Hymenobacter chitinivorans DSM 11115]